MKKVIAFVLTALFFVACIKPDAPKTYTPEFWNWSDSVYGLKATVNGVQYEIDSASLLYSEGSGWKVVGGTGSGGASISVASKEFSVGTVYPLKAGSANSVGTYVASSNEVFSSSTGPSGECKILENDGTHIKGLFYFETISPISGSRIKVEKGYFKAAK